MGPDQEDFTKTRVFTGSPQIRALIRAGRELAGHRPLAELFAVIMDLSVEAVGAGRGVLMTLDGENLVRARRARRRIPDLHRRPRSRHQREGFRCWCATRRSIRRSASA